ncbi:hypothetical protein [Clostridium sp. BJN0001]|uniref:hypothetical protein n=1 Tax=Clostridium sp. BJN0001 TaxID=2930219 RepID=UPI001FD29DDD|nr:hypothetical protein [Clostridium sp. BJN0001]
MNEKEFRQSELKEKLINFLNENGVKQRFIAKKIGVHEATVSRFLKRNNYYLSDDYFKRLETFLNNKIG